MKVEALKVPVSFSYCVPRPKKTVFFNTLSLEDLREFAKPAWPNATRAQMLAWLHNRYPCGYYIEELYTSDLFNLKGEPYCGMQS